jgi:hypothetical protein
VRWRARVDRLGLRLLEQRGEAIACEEERVGVVGLAPPRRVLELLELVEALGQGVECLDVVLVELDTSQVEFHLPADAGPLHLFRIAEGVG